ncbi:MAG: M48 family metallopeptidase [Vitreoscilla sp.]
MTDAPASAPDDAAPLTEIGADYFDGRTARAHPVRVHVADGALVIADADGVRQRVPLASLRWPERTRHGARLMHLPDGASLHCADSVAWDTWSADAAGRRDSLVVRAQQRWKWTLASTLVLVLLLVVGYRHLLPWAARGVVALMPESADETIGELALNQIDDSGLMQPSTLSPREQQGMRDAFEQAVGHLPAGDAPRHHLEFRKSGIGPNAFALPGGAIVLTDELYRRMDGDRDILVGVLGHELGHLRHRHGMRMLVQAGTLGAATGALYGDFSSLFAQIPVLLGQASYSRDAEHEADVDAVRLLRANRISPRVMAQFFVKVRQPRAGEPASSGARLPIAFASHPADEERIRYFEQAAADGR